jgi:predicted MPP superfamily phosphohydrolase
LIEPTWLAIKQIQITTDPTIRLLHFSDLHYKGDRATLKKVVQKINSLSPDFSCFTGDIVEDAAYLPEALDILSGIQSHLYGVPGNHDYWSGSSFQSISACFKATGGDWLSDKTTVSADDRCIFEGVSSLKSNIQRQASDFAMPGKRFDNINIFPADPTDSPPTSLFLTEERVSTIPSTTSRKHILLSHYPAIVKELDGTAYDVLLSGHSHGGQVRIPFFGPLIVPYGVEGYDAGLYSTPSGPLHVSVGIGTFFLPVRFFCRPELTIIEI